MLRRSLPLVLVCLFLVSSAAGQTFAPELSTFEIDGHTAVVKLGIINPDSSEYSMPVHIELLDTANVERASAQITTSIAPGKQLVQVRMELGDLAKTEGNELMWFRLRWAIGETRGITPLTDIFHDNFGLRVSSAGWLAPGQLYRIFVESTFAKTNEPVGGVELAAVLIAEKKDGSEVEFKASGVTAADGSAFLDVMMSRGTELGDDRVQLIVAGTRKGLTITATDTIDLISPEPKFLIMTDKPLFQPGETINIRGILMRTVGGVSIEPGREVELRIEDPDDTLLFRRKLVTSEFGVAFTEWQIPANAKLGGYTIEARSPDDDEEIGRLLTKVARYDLPNFVVEAEADKQFYLPADNAAEITVSANYVFGKPVPKGKVRLVEEIGRTWSWSEQKYEYTEGRTIEGETDADGKFTASFDIAEQMKEFVEDESKDDAGYSSSYRKYEEVSLTAYFTDAATNRTEQKRFDLRLSRQPIHVYISDIYVDNVNELPSRLYVAAFYPDGTPAECDIDISISEEDADKYSSLTRVRTNKYGLAAFELLRPDYQNDDADVDLRLRATDAKGNIALYKDSVWYYGNTDALRVSTNKTIYKPGEDIDLSIISTLDDTRLVVQVFDGSGNSPSNFSTDLVGGKARMTVPYEPRFEGSIFIVVYSMADGEGQTTGVVYPEPSGINVKASFDKPVYKPGEEGSLEFVVTAADGSPVEAALGVSVFDRAVSLRGIADGSGDVVSYELIRALGSGGRFGGVTMDDINRLDLSKPIPEDIDLVAERMLRRDYWEISWSESSNHNQTARRAFGKYFDEQMKPFEDAIDKWFKEKNFDHPTDRASFDRIMAANGLDLDKILDPWDGKYYVKFGFKNDKDTIKVYSNGLDRKPNTDDDIQTLSLSYSYFDRTGKAINEAVEHYHERTGKFIRDRSTLLRELGIRELKDRYGNPLLIAFSVDDLFYVINIKSAGENGRADTDERKSDDFQLWRSRMNYASDIQDSVRKILEESGEKPVTETEFRSLLARNGMAIPNIRDGYGSSAYLNVRVGSRYIDRPRVVITRDAEEKEPRTVTKFTPVTQDFVRFDIRSIGEDRKFGTRDDFTLATNVVVTRSVSKDEDVIERYVVSDKGGALLILTRDQLGAVIPGVEVTIKGENFLRKYTSDKTGNLLVSGLEPGIYSVVTTAISGFAASEVTGVRVVKDRSTVMDIILYAMSETLDVMVADDPLGVVVDATDSKVATNVVSSPPLPESESEAPKLAGGFIGFTPRLREYFPETLLWRPDLVTDAEGRVTANFKMADNITTWQMYAVASDRSGRVTLTEGEVSAFRPFFIDLDPPRYLTEGDVISLPVQIRNYTETEQAADVSMAKGDWFSIRGDARRDLSIPAGSSENAVFTFRADKATEGGNQRVTAIASGDSDAVEKSVTVSPNGKKIVHSESAVFIGSGKFEIDVPTDAINGTAKAEIKLYPNLFAHVVEAQSGLLRRPVGCGEQVISAAYPNLMILRFPNANAAIKQKALRNLREGYEKLVGYRGDDGGFTYWGGKSKPSPALTAYALRFLVDAKEFIAVDPDIIEDAEEWLLKRLQSDGWRTDDALNGYSAITANRTLTAYIVRTLAMLKPEPDSRAAKKLDVGLGLVRGYSDHFNEPYRLVLYGLAAFDAGKPDEAAQVAERLAAQALTEADGEYWKLETNTVFYGWGTPGRVATTALVVQFLSRVDREKYAGHIAKGLVFLLKNKDGYGVWFSTQTTVNVLDCFLEVLRGTDANAKVSIKVNVNGRTAKEFVLEPDAIDQQTADISAYLHSGKNAVEIVTGGPSSIMAQAVAEHYAAWGTARTSPVDVTGNRAVRLKYDCGGGKAAIMETITCTASVERIGFRGYGMLMAELGVPPGADIDRASLDEAMVKEPSISRYEILPDRIIFYLYAKPGGTTFSFVFCPRYAIDALAPASAAYDYYNPLARAEVMPMRFVVK